MGAHCTAAIPISDLATEPSARRNESQTQLELPQLAANLLYFIIRLVGETGSATQSRAISIVIQPMSA